MPVEQVSIRVRRRAGIAFIAAGLWLAACSDPGVVVRQADLRQAPSNDSAVLASIPRGGSVTVKDCANGWCSVSWTSRSGYVLAKDVRIGAAARASTDAGAQGSAGTPGHDDSQDDNLAVPDAPVASPM
jgi:uncharacterized protein YraI